VMRQKKGIRPGYCKQRRGREKKTEGKKGGVSDDGKAEDRLGGEKGRGGVLVKKEGRTNR